MTALESCSDIYGRAVSGPVRICRTVSGYQACSALFRFIRLCHALSCLSPPYLALAGFARPYPAPSSSLPHPAAPPVSSRVGPHPAPPFHIRSSLALSGPSRPYPAASGGARLYSALSVSGRIRPCSALFGRIRPYPAVPGFDRPYPAVSGRIYPATF